MHELIVETAKDIDRLIEHFGSDPRADASMIGLTGFSMGGFLTFYVAAHCPAIQAAVPMAGLPAFTARWEDVVLESSSYESWAEQMAAAQEETAQWTNFMREIDPFDRIKGFYPRALMMINGDRDLDSPKKYLVDLYRTLKPVYTDLPGRLRLNIHDDAGHELTPAMMEDVCNWFTEHLLGDQPGSVLETEPSSGGTVDL
jgi:pimeloyl-ACP methyl ester carboxylesterase